jgi:hypothetical protein
MRILQPARLQDGTEVTIVQFNEDKTVVVGYRNLLGKYKRMTVHRLALEMV